MCHTALYKVPLISILNLYPFPDHKSFRIIKEGRLWVVFKPIDKLLPAICVFTSNTECTCDTLTETHLTTVLSHST